MAVEVKVKKRTFA